MPAQLSARRRPPSVACVPAGNRNPVTTLAPFPCAGGVPQFLNGILTHSLKPQALLREFLLLLREVIGVNRAVIFLRNPSNIFGGSDARTRRIAGCGPRAPSVWSNLSWSTLPSISRAASALYLRKHGRILKSSGADVQGDREMMRGSFNLLGGNRSPSPSSIARCCSAWPFWTSG